MIHKLCVHPGKLKWFTYSHHLFEKDSIFFQPSTFMTFGVPAVNFQVLDSGWNILGMKPATGIQHLLPTFALWTKGGGRAVPILLKICTGRKTWRHSNFDRSKLQQNVCVFFFVVVVLIGDWGGRVFFSNITRNADGISWFVLRFSLLGGESQRPKKLPVPLPGILQTWHGQSGKMLLLCV